MESQGDEKTTQHTMDNGHNKPTKRKNSDEEAFDSDQAYLERYKKNREEILKAKIFFPRFLMMTSGLDEKSLSRLSTFAIQKGIQGLVGEPKTIKRLRSGDLLIEVDRKTHFTKLLAITELALEISSQVAPKPSRPTYILTPLPARPTTDSPQNTVAPV